jgi:GntR family transcriptional regulator, transcriptional repressor for pyruvate dehydrogenase complex
MLKRQNVRQSVKLLYRGVGMDPLFAPIKSLRTFEEVSAKIKDLIFDGVLKPGDHLPSETELAQQFDVSRQTIREALRILEQSGFITVKKGGSGGPLIENTILNSISALYIDAFRMERITLEELTVARWEIEKALLFYVVRNADDDDFDRLRENLAMARTKLSENHMATEENLHFHRLLARASKNHVFVMMIESLLVLLGDLLTRLDPDLAICINTLQYHERILDAIIERDLAKSVDLMEEHFLRVKEHLGPFARLPEPSRVPGP